MLARAATAPELVYYRSQGKVSKLRGVVFHPRTIFAARINQTFSTFDGVLELAYDGGVGTYTDAIADMTVLIGSTAGAWDIGVCRLRGIDADKVFINQTSDIRFANDLHITVVDDFGLWAKHILIDVDGIPYMDGGVAYSDQHSVMDPVPVMGGNRVLKLTGATVETTFDWSYSYMPDGSAIDTYDTYCPTASGGSGLDTDSPTLEFDVGGWHLVYLTLTGVNGASFFGVRYVWIEDADNRPAKVLLGPNSQDIQTGGWQFTLTMFDGVDLSDVRDHAMVILFTEDHYNGEQVDIGRIAGCENVVVTGWIAKEKIFTDLEQQEVTFTLYTAQYWLSKIPSYPNGVELCVGTPAAWTEMYGLTVDLGLWHFLHWRTTATRVMDVFLTGDTKYTKEVSSLMGNLWGQLNEIAYQQLLARVGVTDSNQLFIQRHPQYTPEDERGSFVTVMSIEKRDRHRGVEFDRVVVPESAVISTSGVAVDITGDGLAYFGLSPGHTFPHYGTIESLDNLLVDSQDEVNTLAGLVRGHRNNQLPDIPIKLKAFVRLIGCFPVQRCYIEIDAADNPRGYGYAGHVYPTLVSYVTEPETGYVHTEVNFEAETFEDINVNGDFLGSGDTSVPPTPPPFPMPDFPPTIPGTTPPVEYSKILLHDVGAGMIYTLNFEAVNPTWLLMNSGLTTTQKQNVNEAVITPSGEIYIARRGPAVNAFIAYAPSVGGAFTIIEDTASIEAKYPGSGQGVVGIGCNPLTGQVAYVIGGNATANIYIGTGVTFVAGALINNIRATDAGSLSYGFGKWRLTAHIDSPWTAAMWTFPASGATVSASIDLSDTYGAYHTPVSTSDKLIHWGTFSGKLRRSTGNGTAITGEIGDPIIGEPACDPTGFIIMGDWGVGRKGFSTDEGYSWAALPVLPVSPGYSFAYVGAGSGNVPATTRWIAARATIRYSTDMGQTVWINKEGNINALVFPAAYPTINIVRVVG